MWSPHLLCGSVTYQLPVPAGVDPVTGVLWIQNEQDVVRAVFGAIAERVFESGSPKHYGLALQQAVTMDYRSRFKSEREAVWGEPDEVESPEVAEDQPQGDRPSVDVKKAHPAPASGHGYQPAVARAIHGGRAEGQHDLWSRCHYTEAKPRPGSGKEATTEGAGSD